MINISSLDFSITESIRNEVQSMAETIKKHMRGEEKLDITLSKTSPDVFRVNIQTRFMGEDINSHHESHDFHKAMDLCKNHLIKLIDKKKGMKKAKRR